MPSNDLMKYAGMATQMIATLGVAIFLGHQLDKYIHLRFPVFLLLFALLSLFHLFWKIYTDSKK